MFFQFGTITPPADLGKFGADPNEGLGKFINLFVQLLIVGAGIYALFNLILAGYAFMSAGDDPKKLEGAWGKIWQTAMGLVFVAGAFVMAAIFGLLIYGRADALLKPTLPGI